MFQRIRIYIIYIAIYGDCNWTVAKLTRDVAKECCGFSSNSSEINIISGIIPILHRLNYFLKTLSAPLCNREGEREQKRGKMNSAPRNVISNACEVMCVCAHVLHGPCVFTANSRITDAAGENTIELNSSKFLWTQTNSQSPCSHPLPRPHAHMNLVEFTCATESFESIAAAAAGSVFERLWFNNVITWDTCRLRPTCTWANRTAYNCPFNVWNRIFINRCVPVFRSSNPSLFMSSIHQNQKRWRHHQQPYLIQFHRKIYSFISAIYTQYINVCPRPPLPLSLSPSLRRTPPNVVLRMCAGSWAGRECVYAEHSSRFKTNKFCCEKHEICAWTLCAIVCLVHMCIESKSPYGKSFSCVSLSNYSIQSDAEGKKDVSQQCCCCKSTEDRMYRRTTAIATTTITKRTLAAVEATTRTKTSSLRTQNRCTDARIHARIECAEWIVSKREN